MQRLLMIAFRNISRQKRRSLLTGAAMALGVAFTLFLSSFFNGLIDMFMHRTVDTTLGAIQIHKEGYLESDEPLKQDMMVSRELLASIRSVPNVRDVSARISFDGLLTNGSSASVTMVTAIDPAHEYLVCPGRHDLEGNETLTTKDKDSAIVGEELASTLGLNPGAESTLLVSTQKGQSNALGVTVKSLMTINLPLQSKTGMVVTLDFAQQLLRMASRATEYVIAVNNLGIVSSTARLLQKQLGAQYEVLTWRERDALAAQVMDQTGIVLGVIIGVLFLLVATGIINAMLMNVSERVRDIGTMLALGMRRYQVLAIFLLEAMILAILAALVGTVLGFAIVKLVALRGIELTVPDAKAVMIIPFINWGMVIKTVIGASLGAVFAALYPAFRASRLTPIEALRVV